MKRITIKDIAESLNISVSTVSRALSDDNNIRLQTKEMVLQEAERMGYKPNPVATNLKFGRTNTIGVIVPEMVTPYASQVLAGIQEVMHKNGIKVIVANSDERWEQERENIATMERFMVDGIIVNLCDYTKNTEIYKRLKSGGVPTIFFDRIPRDMEVSQVIVDDYQKAFFLTEHLIRIGRKRIVHIKGSKAIYNAELRSRAYQDALKKFNISLPAEQYIVDAGVDFNSGAEVVDKLIRDKVEFDAIFAFTDTLAIGAMNRLKSLEVSIPTEVAIVSFSGTVLSTIVHPQLTTVEPPLREMGCEAANLLLEQIKEPNAPTRSIVLDSQIVVRGSTIEP